MRRKMIAVAARKEKAEVGDEALPSGVDQTPGNAIFLAVSLRFRLDREPDPRLRIAGHPRLILQIGATLVKRRDDRE